MAMSITTSILPYSFEFNNESGDTMRLVRSKFEYVINVNSEDVETIDKEITRT